MLESDKHKFEGKEALFICTLGVGPVHDVKVYLANGSSVVIKATLASYGNTWKLLCGDTDITEGAGETPQLALRNFEKNLIEKINRGARP